MYPNYPGCDLAELLSHQRWLVRFSSEPRRESDFIFCLLKAKCRKNSSFSPTAHLILGVVVYRNFFNLLMNDK